MAATSHFGRNAPWWNNTQLRYNFKNALLNVYKDIGRHRGAGH